MRKHFSHLDLQDIGRLDGPLGLLAAQEYVFTVSIGIHGIIKMIVFVLFDSGGEPDPGWVADWVATMVFVTP